MSARSQSRSRAVPISAPRQACAVACSAELSPETLTHGGVPRVLGLGRRPVVITAILVALTLVSLFPSASLAQAIATPTVQSVADGAQVRTPARPPVRPRRAPLGLRAYGFSDSTQMTAADTFIGVLGSKTTTGVGGGVEVLRLWEGLFARVNYSQSSAEGVRSVVFDGEVIPLGIPMRIKLNPLEAGAGWRADLGRRAIVGVYGGGSLVRMRYRQTSDFAETGEDVDETFNGFSAYGGADVTIARWLMIGAEGQYRTVPNGLGQDGISAELGDTDLGGLTFRVMVGIRR